MCNEQLPKMPILSGTFNNRPYINVYFLQPILTNHIYFVIDRYETRLIKEITDVILKELNSKLLLHVSKNIVGMNCHLEDLKSLIKIESNDVHMIGIYGLGGIGKTAIAKVVYNDISHQFESRIFLKMLEKDPRTNQVYFNYRKNFLMVS